LFVEAISFFSLRKFRIAFKNNSSSNFFISRYTQAVKRNFSFFDFIILIFVMKFLHCVQQRMSSSFHFHREIIQHSLGVVRMRCFVVVAIFLEKRLQKFLLVVRRRPRGGRRNFVDAAWVDIRELRIFKRVAQEVLSEGPFQDRVGGLNVRENKSGARTRERTLIRVVAAHDSRREKRLVKRHVLKDEILNRNARLRRTLSSRKRIEEGARRRGVVSNRDLLLRRNENAPPNRRRGVGVLVGDVADQAVARVARVGLDVDALDAVGPGEAVEGDVLDCVVVV
jgi:hypothetical protein